MKHYLKPGDEVDMQLTSRVECNGPDGFTITDSENSDLEPVNAISREDGTRHKIEWDDGGYYWED